MPLNCRTGYAWTIFIAALIGIMVWQVVSGGFGALHLTFAADQSQIIADELDRATQALQQKPPNVRSAIESIEYIRNYYPSGTKQAPGSTLDTIVERYRALAEQHIFAMLRNATGKDYGTSTDAWIEAIEEQHRGNR